MTRLFQLTIVFILFLLLALIFLKAQVEETLFQLLKVFETVCDDLWLGTWHKNQGTQAQVQRLNSEHLVCLLLVALIKAQSQLLELLFGKLQSSLMLFAQAGKVQLAVLYVTTLLLSLTQEHLAEQLVHAHDPQFAFLTEATSHAAGTELHQVLQQDVELGKGGVA